MSTDLAQLGFTPLDVVAFGWFLVATVGYNIATHGASTSASLLGAIQIHRQRWIANMAARDDRVVDVLLVSNLAQGNTFFASTSVILVGGLSALIGAGTKAQSIIERLPLTNANLPLAWDLKIMMLMGVFTYAFFKFAWAFRLAHYSMIMVGATPPQGEASAAAQAAHAARTARIAGLAGEHSNLGLRAYYFAIAAIGWFFGPIYFLITTTWVLAIVIRREYFSRSLEAISPQASWNDTGA